VTAVAHGRPPGPSGVLVVDKPPGPTSHDVVERVRRVLGVRRAGHTGTLDPFASGVLPVCVGKATRLARFLTEGDKEYTGTVRLGFATDTDDATGRPLGPPRPVGVDLDAVRAACRGLVGEQRQVPPAYSAKHRDGRRLYELAREGVAVAVPAVLVRVHELAVDAVVGDRVEIRVRCSAGTYVRALARDLGASLGVGGHLETLRRTRSGAFGLDGAVGWDDLTQAVGERLVPLSGLLTELPAVVVDEAGLAHLRHGRDLDVSRVQSGFPAGTPPARLRVLDARGALLALAVPRAFGPPMPGLPVVPVLHPDVVLVG
jgi:tRNA pseudouridine55 synthase